MSEFVKVRLLNDGDYSDGFTAGFKFPVTVMASMGNGFVVYVSSNELCNVGAINDVFMNENNQDWPFVIGTECEIIND